MDKAKENEIIKQLKSRIRMSCEIDTEETLNGYTFSINIKSIYFGFHIYVWVSKERLEYDNIDTIVALIIHEIEKQILSNFIVY